MALFEPPFDALKRAEVRYVVVAGVAFVLRGFARLTGDVDLAIDLRLPRRRRPSRFSRGPGFARA